MLHPPVAERKKKKENMKKRLPGRAVHYNEGACLDGISVLLDFEREMNKRITVF